MDAIHNVIDKITGGDGKVTDKDILKAADHLDELKRKKMAKQIDAEKDIAKAAKKLNDEKFDAHIKNLDHNKDVSEAVGNYASEQRRKEMIDAQGAAKIDNAALEAGQVIQRDNAFYGATNTTIKHTTDAVEKQLDLQHEQFKKDIAAEKKLLEAAEEVEKEAHKQKIKNLEAQKDIAEAQRKVEKERIKQMEVDMELDAKIIEAENRLEELKAKQIQQRCQEAAHTHAPGEHCVVVTEKTVIH